MAYAWLSKTRATDTYDTSISWSIFVWPQIFTIETGEIQPLLWAAVRRVKEKSHSNKEKIESPLYHTATISVLSKRYYNLSVKHNT